MAEDASPCALCGEDREEPKGLADVEEAGDSQGAAEDAEVVERRGSAELCEIPASDGVLEDLERLERMSPVNPTPWLFLFIWLCKASTSMMQAISSGGDPVVNPKSDRSAIEVIRVFSSCVVLSFSIFIKQRLWVVTQAKSFSSHGLLFWQLVRRSQAPFR